MADPFVAEIRIFPFNFAPKGWAWCDGQLMPLSQNTALFSLLGTTYGGEVEGEDSDFRDKRISHDFVLLLARRREDAEQRNDEVDAEIRLEIRVRLRSSGGGDALR